MLIRVTLMLLAVCVCAIPGSAQSVLVCTLEKDGAVVKQNESGSVTAEVVKGQPETLVFANLGTTKPILRIGDVEIELELIHTDGDTIWLRSFTPDFIGNGIALWVIDLKGRIVIRSETYKSKQIPSEKWSGKLVGLSSIGKCK